MPCSGHLQRRTAQTIHRRVRRHQTQRHPRNRIGWHHSSHTNEEVRGCGGSLSRTPSRRWAAEQPCTWNDVQSARRWCTSRARLPAPTQIGGLSTMTRAKTPYLPTYPQAAQRSEKWCTNPEKPFGSLLIANPVSSPPPGMYVRATYMERESFRALTPRVGPLGA